MNAAAVPRGRRSCGAREGEVALATDGGEEALGAGMAAGLPAGKGDGHHLVNRSAGDAKPLHLVTTFADDVRSITSKVRECEHSY